MLEDNWNWVHFENMLNLLGIDIEKDLETVTRYLANSTEDDSLVKFLNQEEKLYRLAGFYNEDRREEETLEWYCYALGAETEICSLFRNLSSDDALKILSDCAQKCNNKKCTSFFDSFSYDFSDSSMVYYAVFWETHFVGVSQSCLKRYSQLMREYSCKDVLIDIEYESSIRQGKHNLRKEIKNCLSNAKHKEKAGKIVKSIRYNKFK